MKKWLIIICSIGFLVTLDSCYKEDSLNKPVTRVPYSTDPIDVYIQEYFLDYYGIAIRYKYVDRYVDPTKRVTPPRRDDVIPMLNFISDFWIDPFISVPNGNQFFRKHVPAEIVLIGSLIYNDDGTVTLGTADAGARITLSDVNSIDENNLNWIISQIRVIYHEFAHIVHQRYNLPAGWQEISPEGYTSAGSWYTLTDEEALERGFVSPYATSSFDEDFAETAAFILYHPDFYDIYYNDETNCQDTGCEARNEGRAKIRTKYNAVIRHYEQVTGVDLLLVREIVQSKL